MRRQDHKSIATRTPQERPGNGKERKVESQGQEHGTPGQTKGERRNGQREETRDGKGSGEKETREERDKVRQRRGKKGGSKGRNEESLSRREEQGRERRRNWSGEGEKGRHGGTLALETYVQRSFVLKNTTTMTKFARVVRHWTCPCWVARAVSKKKTLDAFQVVHASCFRHPLCAVGWHRRG